MKLKTLAAAVLLAGMATGAAQAAPWVGNFNTSNGATFNDGLLLNIDGFDIYSQGSAAFFVGGNQLSPTGTTLAIGDIVTTYYQGVVSAFNTGVSSPNLAWASQPGGSYQLTVAAVFNEIVTFAAPGFALVQPISGGRVSVFYDDATLSNSFITSTAQVLAGTGYTDGLLIADGSVSGASLPTSFSTDGTEAGGVANLKGPLTLAQAGWDDPANLADVVGFLPTVPSDYSSRTTLQFGPNEGTSFQTTNFFDAANGWTPVASIAGRTIRADANVNLIPEPATLALLGLGLVGAGLARRRKA